ncbi:MAG: lipoate-protein ligase B, partial [Hyphomicrobiales bacterium]|nr:lipoate-protein ligase B [Hyphomicrobiales bacterium]
MVFKPSPRAAFPASLCRGTVALRRTSGLVPYAQAVARMEARRRAVLAGRARPLVWFLQHPPLFT